MLLRGLPESGGSVLYKLNSQHGCGHSAAGKIDLGQNSACRLLGPLLSAGILLIAVSLPAKAADTCKIVVGKLVSVEGKVEVQHDQAEQWSGAKLNQSLCQGDTLRAGQKSRAAIALVNQAVLRLDQSTTVRLLNISGKKEERSLISLVKGAFQSFSRKPSYLDINTPYLNGSIEGTEFVIRVTDNATSITLFEGQVIAANDQGKVTLNPGQAAEAATGQAPQLRTVVRPRDAAQWALYYPPVLSAAGDTDIQRAARALSVGRVDDAASIIDAVIGKDNTAGLAYALKSVIAVVRNERNQAIQSGRKAVELAPDQAASHIALSYALQADFRIEAARDAASLATQKQTDNALAWARLAELQLMLGDKGAALASANKAVSLAPDSARAQNVLGYSALAGFNPDGAIAAFEKAIAADSADPLPRLGLGLGKIAQGDLEAGRQDIEVAVGLDSNNALLRTYLGKAYYEEGRDPLDEQQLAIARELDPNDPTSYLYNGIRLQAGTRPVEAVAAFQDSIARNDNRAVYRSRMLLDKDRATRGTSLARAYNDLGYTKTAANEASNSLATDPANASAHQFLADSLRGDSRREISRVSEQLQAQLLQDISAGPVLPSSGETGLNISGGSDSGYNDFGGLFHQNRVQYGQTLFGGSNNTRGGEAAVSAVQNRFSISAGVFSYQSDGFRENFDQSHEVKNVFAQAAITSNLNIQIEHKERTTESGDIVFDFDPADYSNSLRRKFSEDTDRIGIRFSPSTDSAILVSVIAVDREENGELSLFTPAFPPLWPDTTTDITTLAEDDTTQSEAAYLFKSPGFNVIAGISSANGDSVLYQTSTPTPITPPFFVPFAATSEREVKDQRAYVYGNVVWPSQITWTLGVSHQKYEDESLLLDLSETSPKFGVKWDVADSLSVRAAYMKNVKPAMASNRTLEPTVIAGFDQYFDDLNGTIGTRYGAGIDWKPAKSVNAGIEGSRRDAQQPTLLISPVPPFTATADTIDRDEWLHRAYIYWSISNNLALTTEAVYDEYHRDFLDPTRSPDVTTVSVPVGLKYFHASGLIAGVTGTYVDQTVARFVGPTPTDYDDFETKFAVYDAYIGYRLPKNQGSLMLSVRNIGDRDFEYQDDSYRTYQDITTISPYLPERTFMGRISLNF